MSDLILRTNALEQMARAECGLHYEDCEANNCSCSYIKRILGIPPAEAEWIPISKRLPEDGVDVLITTENEEIYIDQVITDPYKERYFQSNTGYDNFQVIAWMPLPKPYKAESEVEK